ncbi:Hypothetical protein CINCED_3A001789 [Cinara cedri]|uniref:COMM domain-containing protein n=1 Tax=Cinara cedri TaxID=506608 RepID=A0A5E4NCL3_9HEMI|nr:Hypothetical protein CINCED_3A001789 [Cinara cedri]
MTFENLAKDHTFVSGFKLLNNVENNKFFNLIDKMMKDFNPNKSSMFREQELLSMETSLKLDSDLCSNLLNSLNRLLRQVVSDMTKPAVLKNVLSELFLLDMKKVELFCECWTANVEQIVSRLQQNFTHSYRLKDVNWALNISSNVGIELSNPEPRCLIELKVEDSQHRDNHKINEIFLDFNEEDLKKFYDMLETIKLNFCF